MTDLLRALAEAATPERWDDEDMLLPNATIRAYIAACSPERILALIAEVEEYRERAAGPVNGGAATITPDIGLTISETDIVAQPVKEARHAR